VLVTLGYNSVAPQSEAASISKDVIDDLKRRFKKIIVLYDLDTAGFKHSKELCLEHDIECVSLPDKYDREGKDISDYRQQYGEEETKNILEEILQKDTTVKLIDGSGNIECA
jgi:DNA primase